MHKKLMVIGLSFLIAIFVWKPTIAQQLDQTCIINILNRTVQVAPDGGWSMPNVPSTMGQVRARATCTRDGKTTSGQTDFFLVARNGVTQTGSFRFGSLEPPPSALTFEPSDAIQITGAQTTLALKVIATFPDDSTRDVTESNSGINYTSTNPAIANVDAEGLVTGQSSGNALIIARLDGALAVLQLSVLTSGDSDGDGLPDDYEIANGLNPNDPVDAQEDQDNDGLSALSEFIAGTEPNNADTDGDAILDGEELVIGEDNFTTNPLLFDTDGDGIGDGLEIATGSDPTDASSFNLAGALSSIKVMPSVFTLTFNTVFSEASRQLTVTGTLSDGNTIDLTSSAKGTTYTTSDISICSFGADNGRVFAGVDGTCTVTASNSGFSSSTNIVVQTFTPTSLSFIPIPGTANNVDVNGDFAYIAAGSSGLQVVNVADRSAPTMAGSVDTPGNANDVKVVGGTAFVADGISGLQIIDVADPSEPSIIGTIDTPGDAQDVIVKDNLAYVADGNAGLQIIDLINRNIIGSVDTPGTAFGVAVDNTIAIIADRNAGVQVIDISDSVNPVIVGTIDTGDAWDVVLNEFNDFVFVADLVSSFTSIDITDPENPIIQATTNTSNGGLLKDVVLNNDLAFGADFFFVNGVPIIDVANPRIPISRLILNFSGFRDDNGTGIATDSSFVYLTAAKGSDSRLYIGQYLALQDFGGIAPAIEISSPIANLTVFEGAPLQLTAQANDDIAVESLSFLINGEIVFTDTAVPYEFTLTVPTGVTDLFVGALATDLGGNIGVADEVQITVIPDPLTTVIGTVVDISGVPVAGANASTLNNLFETTLFDGTFSIIDVPTVQGDIQVRVVATVDDIELTGNSLAVTPIPGGTTETGVITIIDVPLGHGVDNPALSCLSIQQNGTNDGNRKYWIFLSSGVFEMHCDFTSDTGGWTRVGALDGTTGYCQANGFNDMRLDPDVSAGKIPDPDVQALITGTPDSPMDVMYFSRSDERYIWHKLEKVTDFDTNNKHNSSAYYCTNWNCDDGSIDASACGGEGQGCPVTAHGVGGSRKKIYVDSSFSRHIRGMHTNGNICGLPNYERASIWVYVR